MFSIDDSQEYKADFVLATLLDPGGPTQCPSPSTLSHIPSAGQSAQKQQNGHRGDASRVSRDLDSCMDEDGVDQDQLLDNPVVSKQGRKRSPRDRSRTNISAVDSISTQGPSGASHAQSHVPPPPSDVDIALMDVDSALFAAPPPPRATRRAATGRRDASTESHRVYDPVDALFEFENQNDVADDGDMFGRGEVAGAHPPGAMGTAGEGRGKGKGKGKEKQQEQERTDTLTGQRAGGRATVPSGEDQFFDDFPYKGQCEATCRAIIL